MLEIFERNGNVVEPWRLKSHRLAKVGDRVWLLKQGKGPKVIFGVGEITSAPRKSLTGEKKIQWMVDVRFSRFTDPRNYSLIGESDVRRILPPNRLNSQSSGISIEPEIDDELERLSAAPTKVQSTSTEPAGEDWTASEIQQIVTNYYAMLDREIAGQPYSKTEHRKAMASVIHRSEGSIEFKHQNISAVLDENGYRWISGYKPRDRYQTALSEEVLKQAKANGSKYLVAPLMIDSDIDAMVQRLEDYDAAFVEKPNGKLKKAPEAGARALSKRNYSGQDERNKSLGDNGERYVLKLERRKLVDLGRPDLAAKVVHVSAEQGDGAGYDIESYDKTGLPIFIEVKTTTGSIDSSFFVSENERVVAVHKAERYRLYRVFDWGKKPRIYCLQGKFESCLTLTPTAYRAEIAVLPAADELEKA